MPAEKIAECARPQLRDGDADNKSDLESSGESGITELALLQASANRPVTARRECLMVIGTGKDSETVALFKLLEWEQQI